MNIRDVQLDLRRIEHLQRIEKGDRGEGIAGRIDDDAAGFFAGLMHAFHKLALEIGLAEVDGKAEALSLCQAPVPDIGQRRRAIDRGLALPQQVEIRSVEHKNGSGHAFQERSSDRQAPAARGAKPG